MLQVDVDYLKKARKHRDYSGPIILIFFWMRSSAIHDLVVILPTTVYWVTLTPLWHAIGSVIYGGKATIPYGIGWLLWYMICTFGMSQILRKFLGFKQGF